MPELLYDGKRYHPADNETVLDCLTRHEVAVPHACGQGVCQSCVMRAVRGTPPQASQKGLKAGQVERGVFLACRCVASEDLEVIVGDNAARSFTPRVVGNDRLSDSVARLRLERPPGFDYHAGQFLNLTHPSGHTRSYSLASVPALDPYLELHIRRLPGGLVSNWIHDTLQVGDPIHVSEALGNSYYVSTKPDQSMLLIATGCGLSAMYGVLRDALHQHHRGEIHLYHGSHVATGLYYYPQLEALRQKYPQFHYHPCVSGDGPVPDGLRRGRANDLALVDHPKLNGWRVYLCGQSEMVNATRRKVFLAGASMSEILADPFVLAQCR